MDDDDDVDEPAAAEEELEAENEQADDDDDDEPEQEVDEPQIEDEELAQLLQDSAPFEEEVRNSWSKLQDLTLLHFDVLMNRISHI